MKEQNDKSDQPLQKSVNDGQINFPAFPLYPVDDDIYYKSQREKNINVEDSLKLRELNQNNVSGNDLDVPGSELDDVQENIGSEDEENNSYSLGGDNHNDLEEDKGE